MKKKFILMTGLLLSLGVTAAAEEVNPNSAPIENPVSVETSENERLQEAEQIVNGVVHDTAQKILPISIEARYFSPHMDITILADDIRFNDGKVSLKDDLGFGNDKTPEFIFRYNRFTLDYIHLHSTGSRHFTNDNPLIYGGLHLAGDVNSRSNLDYLKLQITNPIVNVLGSGVDWSYGLTGVFWNGTATGTQAETLRQASKSKNFNLPIPTLGVGAHASLLPSLKAYANFSGMTFGSYGHVYDVEAGIRYNPVDFLGVDIGYRKIRANIKHNDDKGTFDMKGPFAGIRYDF